jgi:demethylmenaquinone methyltransferase/2-methoxy-6-polyprenyl-1,4-benzoquinol methylase
MHGPGDVRFFHRIAPLFDLVMPAPNNGPLTDGFALADRPVERVLDLGGGTGRVAGRLDVAETFVLDPARGMLARAASQGIESVQGDGRSLPLATESVDAVVAVDALHHMPDQSRVLTEAARVLAPGGVLVIREFDPDTALGTGLVFAERLVGFSSTFRTARVLTALVERQGLEPTVLDDGFEYTVAGVKPADAEKTPRGRSEPGPGRRSRP